MGEDATGLTWGEAPGSASWEAEGPIECRDQRHDDYWRVGSQRLGRRGGKTNPDVQWLTAFHRNRKTMTKVQLAEWRYTNPQPKREPKKPTP